VPDEKFPTLRAQVPHDSSLLVYSDGAIEVWREPTKLWGIEGLLQFIRDHNPTDPACLDDLYETVKSMSSGDTLADDFSIVMAHFT
jgi:serine phosphatase RsbU (regulator of sigma subunit)